MPRQAAATAFVQRCPITLHTTSSTALLPLRQTNLVTVGPDDKLSDAEAKLKGIEGMPVVDADGKASWLAGWPGW